MSKKIIFMMWVSGAGKTTVINELLQSRNDLILVPSYVTRSPRMNERNGRKYRFISKDEFMQWVENGEFLEHALVHGKDYYGTKLADIQKVLDMDKTPIKELDMYGLEKIQNEWKLEKDKYYSIFLNITDVIMIERILERWAMPQEEMDSRIQSAQRERKLATELCDFTVEADQKLEKVVEDILNIIDGNQ